MDEVLFRSAEPVKIKLERGQMGGIGWEISVKGDDPAAILSRIEEIHQYLLEKYREESPG